MAGSINRAKPTSLKVGIAGIERWRDVDEIHLPAEKATAPVFMPEQRHLDEILKRETLDERLNRHLAPHNLEPDLLSPAVLTATRRSLVDKIGVAADLSGSETLLAAHDLVASDIALDQDVQDALAALLQG